MSDKSNASPGAPPRRRGTLSVHTVTIAHGGGGRAMRDLVDDVFINCFVNGPPSPLEDQARFALADLAHLGDRLAFTSDGFVVDPLVFPGGDIGKLAVCGTINDLAVGGARPLYLSCAVIIEEGLSVETLRNIARSMADTAAAAGVRIVTGDTKVVPRGACDKLFITTSGIGIIRPGVELGVSLSRPGDAVVINGWIGDHGAAILAARGDLALSSPVESDCAALHNLIGMLLDSCPATRFIRDATRGGIASVLNEIAEAAGVAIEISEEAIPVRPEVRGLCEILGLDPLYLANEGKIICVVPHEFESEAIAALKAHPLGRNATVIGKVGNSPSGRVIMRTIFGGKRVVDMLTGDQLPRIC